MSQMDSAYFQRIFENSHVFLIETRNTASEPIEKVSPNIATLLGYTSDDISDGVGHYDDVMHPDDIAQYLLESQQGSLSETCDEVMHGPYRLIHKRGYCVWVKDAAQVIRVDGKVDKIIHVLSDITQEMHHHSDLEDNKTRLLKVLHQAGFGLWEYNSAQSSILCDDNFSHLIGFKQSLNSIKLTRFYAMIHPEDIISFRQKIEELGAGKRTSLRTEVRVRHLSGKWRYHLCNGTSTETDIPEQMLVNMSHSDLTDQKETELSAIAALSTRNQFFARVSHEIRTPLHGILGMLSLVKQELAQQKAKDKIDKIIANSEHLLYLLNDILDLAKLNEAKLKISLELTSVTEVIRQVERLFSFKANEKKLQLKTTIPSLQQDMVMTDKVRITQILSNLVSNAIKYTHNGTVHIYTSIQDDELVLNVKDTGIGIKNTFDVFDAYNQEAAGYAQGPSSTGLGLEIVKKLSDLLGIDLQLVSGKSGTLFSLSLGKPMPNTLVATQPDAPTKESDHHFNGLNILIVDDSDINREIVKTMLEGIGGICVEAEDGYEAVKMVNNDNSFDVVLMDKHMPNMNGIDATQQIRRNTDLELQPIIIALTADAFDVDSEKWFSLGVNEIITKPFDMTVLTKTIVRCLRK